MQQTYCTDNNIYGHFSFVCSGRVEFEFVFIVLFTFFLMFGFVFCEFGTREQGEENINVPNWMHLYSLASMRRRPELNLNDFFWLLVRFAFWLWLPVLITILMTVLQKQLVGLGLAGLWQATLFPILIRNILAGPVQSIFPVLAWFE